MVSTCRCAMMKSDNVLTKITLTLAPRIDRSGDGRPDYKGPYLATIEQWRPGSSPRLHT